MKLRNVLFAALSVLGAGGAMAQEGKAVVQASQESTDPAKKLEALIERFNHERTEVIAAYRKAETDEERQEILARLPGAGYIPEFRALAEEAKGSDTAAQAWIWVLRLADDDPTEAWKAVQVLLAEHLQSTVMAELSGELRYASHAHGEERVIEALRTIVEGSPHANVRAGGLFTLGAVLLDSRDHGNQQEGRSCFEEVIAEYGSVPYGGDSTYKAAAERYLYELDHLQIGMPAPDFETVDENGVPWKLSDYKGKVVVIDFWGFW